MARLIELLAPFSVSKQIEARIQRLTQVLKYKKSRQQDAPEGKLKIVKSHGTIQYVKVSEASGAGCSYIPKSKKALIRALAQKEYDAAVIRRLEKDIAALTKGAALLEESSPAAFTKLHPEKQKLVQPLTLPDEQFASQWLGVEYRHKGFKKEAPEFFTSKGERVRSKSEVIIADTLARLGVLLGTFWNDERQFLRRKRRAKTEGIRRRGIFSRPQPDCNL